MGKKEDEKLCNDEHKNKTSLSLEEEAEGGVGDAL